jgi:cytochrome c551/c552
MPQQNLAPKAVDNLIAFFRWVNNINTLDWPPQDSDKMASSSVRKLIAMVGMSPGAALFKDKGCLGCHRVGEVGSDVGPTMEKVGSKYNKETLALYSVDPKKANPSSKMPPQPHVQPQEAKEIANFLAELK